MDNRLSLSENITAVTRTCRFFLYNIRRIRPFLTTYSTQLLVQAMVLSCLDYCNSLLAGLPASAIRPLQLIHNAAARLIFNVPKFTHTTSLLKDLHWLPVMARIKFKTLVLAYQTVKGSATAYIQQLIGPYTPARPLRSTTSGRLAPPAVTPAHPVHDCSLFWPHDGGMTFLWTSEQLKRCPRSNADWKLISSDCISPSLPHN